MIKKEKKTFKDGSVKTYIKVVEGYRPGPKMPPKQRTIKSFGYLEDQADPDAFMEEVRLFNLNRRADEKLRIEVASNALMYQGNNPIYNYGHCFLSSVFDLLELEPFLTRKSKELLFRDKYSVSDIFRFLVVSRILNPDSKRADIQRRDIYYGLKTEFELQDIYRALDKIYLLDAELQLHLHRKITNLTGRDLSHTFYDVTNYYTEIDFNDETDGGLRKRGVSKEHRVDPIVQMGLFIDSNGIPVNMKVFPGNTSDTITLVPAIENVRENFGAGRIVVIADKGLNSGKNIDYLCNHGDGFVFSQILRGKKGQRYQEQLFGEDGWVEVSTDYRYKLFNETYLGKDEHGKQLTRTRRVLLYYNGADARMAQKKREEKLKRAEKATKNNAYGIAHGIDAYIKEQTVDCSTGEIIENKAVVRSLDVEKAEADALYDGYFCLITSELEYDAAQIRKAYGNLWRIEQSFRIMKSDLNARPLYVRTSKHITAHFLVCYAALMIMRLIQYYMGKEALPPERLARALNAATCEKFTGGVMHLQEVGGIQDFEKRVDKNGNEISVLKLSESNDELAYDYRLIQKYFHTDFYYVYPKQEVFNRFIKSIKLVEHNKSI